MLIIQVLVAMMRILLHIKKNKLRHKQTGNNPIRRHAYGEPSSLPNEQIRTQLKISNAHFFFQLDSETKAGGGRNDDMSDWVEHRIDAWFLAANTK